METRSGEVRSVLEVRCDSRRKMDTGRTDLSWAGGLFGCLLSFSLQSADEYPIITHYKTFGQGSILSYHGFDDALEAVQELSIWSCQNRKSRSRLGLNRSAQPLTGASES